MCRPVVVRTRVTTGRKFRSFFCLAIISFAHTPWRLAKSVSTSFSAVAAALRRNWEGAMEATTKSALIGGIVGAVGTALVTGALTTLGYLSSFATESLVSKSA